MDPRVSIIIVNFNGAKWLEPCLNVLAGQTYKNFEIIVVDNGSKDGSIDLISKKYPKILLVRNKINKGFAGGNNDGFKHASGELVLLLNNDTTVGKDYLKDFIGAFKKIPDLGIAQSKIVLMDNNAVLDSCGSFWTDTSFLYHFGNGKDQGLKIYNKPFRVFSVKGASMLIKKELIDKIGLFDGDFWSYYEETDFCHRAWLAGYESWYWPKAVVYHAQGGTSLTLFNKSYIQFHNFKNKLLSILKNFDSKNLLYYIPLFIFLNIIISIAWIFLGKIGHSFSLYKAIGWNISHFSATMAKRKKIQKLRTVSDENYLRKIKKNPNIKYYYYLLRDEIKKFKD